MARPFKCNRDLNGDRIVIRVCLDDLRKSCGDYMFREKLAALVWSPLLSTKSRWLDASPWTDRATGLPILYQPL